MANSPQPQRQDWSAVTDADLAALLTGKAGAAPGLRPVADILAALTAEASTGELTGEARALAAFRRRVGTPALRRAARWTPAGLTSWLGAKVAAAATAAALVLGGAATAAYANVLPAPIQRFAHETIGAPSPYLRPDLLSHGRSAGDGRHAPGDHAAHGQAAAHGPGQPSSPATTFPAQGSQGAGNHGGPNGAGSQGSSHGQQGAGQGQGSGQGQQGTGQSQSASRDPVGMYGNPSPQVQPARPPAQCGVAGATHGPVVPMEDSYAHVTTSGPVPRPGCGVVAVRWAGWPA